MTKRHRRAASAALDATRCAMAVTMMDLASTCAVQRRLARMLDPLSQIGEDLNAAAAATHAAADELAQACEALSSFTAADFRAHLSPPWWRRRAGAPNGAGGMLVPVGGDDIEPGQLPYAPEPEPARPVFLLPDL